MQTVNLSSATVPPLPIPTEPIHEILVLPNGPSPLGAGGRLNVLVELRDVNGRHVTMKPHSRSRIQLSLEPPAAPLQGRATRQAFAGRVSFGLRAHLPPGEYRLRATVVGSDFNGLSVSFTPNRLAGGVIPAPSLNPVQILFDGRIDDVKINQQWQVPIRVFLTDAFGQICPTDEDKPVMVELRLGKFTSISEQSSEAPLLGQQFVQNGIATFLHLKAPAFEGVWSLVAIAAVPDRRTEWKDIADDEDPDAILQEVQYVTG